ncbi:MAG: DsbA family protein [Candidatus Yanofskybacteria bacterium]|nr:DsbA family protein [Candidatus Yanofskybacteria bacterium]
MEDYKEPEMQNDESVSVKKSFWSFAEKNFLGLSIMFGALVISGSLIYTNGGGSGINDKAQIQQGTQGNVKADVSVDDDPFLGNKNAKVTIIEFSDYQCPFCRTFWKESFGQLKEEYIDTGKVKLVYRDYPLSFHAMAMPLAQASECADDQGKYWGMHDKIFAEQEKLGQGTVQFTVQDIKRWASEIGVDKGSFNQCLDSAKYKAEVDKDTADGTAAGVNGTPSFFINGRLTVGAQPYSVFKSMIEEELNKK